jgi:tetratricopeptide (TPR) repeat protein
VNRSLPLRLSALTLVLVATAAQHWAQDTDRAAEEQYRFLVGLVERGLHEEAVREGTRFLRGHPDSPRAPLARYRLADALWQLDRHRDAAREYEVLGALDGFEYRSESLFRVGEAARESGDEARARRAFEQVLAGDQAYLHAPARLALADIDFRAGATEDAERGYRELLRAAPDSPEASAARRGLAWCAW